MKMIAIVLLSLAIIFLGVKIYGFWRQEQDLNAQLSEIQGRLMKAQTNEKNLEEDTQYLANPANLEKELRSRFNYKKPAETMIVIVPAQSSTAATTTQ